MAWIKIRFPRPYHRLFDFGNGRAVDNVAFGFHISNQPYFGVCRANVCAEHIVSNRSLTLNQWTHVAYSIDKNFGSIYLNGNLTAKTPNNGEYTPRFIARFYNYFGRSNWPEDQDADADIDEVKIFFKSLSVDQIKYEMTNEIYN